MLSSKHKSVQSKANTTMSRGQKMVQSCESETKIVETSTSKVTVDSVQEFDHQSPVSNGTTDIARSTPILLIEPDEELLKALKGNFDNVEEIYVPIHTADDSLRGLEVMNQMVYKQNLTIAEDESNEKENTIMNIHDLDIGTLNIEFGDADGECCTEEPIADDQDDPAWIPTSDNEIEEEGNESISITSSYNENNIRDVEEEIREFEGRIEGDNVEEIRSVEEEMRNEEEIVNDEEVIRNDEEIRNVEEIREAEDTNNNKYGISKYKERKVNKRKQQKKRRDAGELKQVKPNPCLGKKCPNECASICDDDRELLFKEYYKFNSYEQKKNWILSCISVKDIKRKRTKEEVSRRKKTMEYKVILHGREKKVCQQFLLKTLDISQMTLRHTIQNVTNTHRAKPDGRGKHAPKNKTSDKDIASVKKFIDKLPVVPSHYCRKKSKKLYLPVEIGNLTNLERIYIADSRERNVQPVKRDVFRKIFKQFNFSFHVPKKDKCSHCEQVKQTGIENLNESDRMIYNKHKDEVKACQMRFLQDQNNQEEDFLCASFDLQKVLNTPCGKSMLLYYSRKIAVYNFTIYESRTKNGLCYIWNETCGKKGSYEICTSLFKYLKDVDQNRPQISTIVFYCDNCSGQNKNRQMIVMFNTFLKNSKNLKRITINYLIAGHTYMPADSVHSTIDSFISKKIIYAPSQWPTVISLARHNPKPYQVFSLSYTDFDDWTSFEADSKCIPKYSLYKDVALEFNENQGIQDAISEETNNIGKRKVRSVNNTKAKSSKRKNERKGKLLRISKITSIEMTSGNACMSVKYSYMDSTADKQEFLIKNANNVQLKKCYSAQLPISTLKYKDLQKLCKQNAIIPEYHAEYRAFNQSKTVIDTLPETDEEDDLQEEPN